MKAVDLLVAFSGERAQQYESAFQYSEQSRIVSVELHAVGTESTTVRYTDEPVAWKEVNNIVRIKTADGFEAISGVTTNSQGAFSDKHLVELKSVVTELLRLETLDPVEVGVALKRAAPGLNDKARASVDIALWDLAARKVGKPLYQMLGAKRHSIDAYASFPFFDSIDAHVIAVEEGAKLGFSSFKFHAWGKIEKDLQLIDKIQRSYSGSSYRFMLDVESAYSIEEALDLGRTMDPTLFTWLEAPVDDACLEEYAELRRELAVLIIPAGNSFYSPEFMRQGIESRSWDAGRFDVTVIGGFSKAIRLMSIANEAGLPIELQSWDHSLSQIANLHLMLANERTRYFEAPMPTKAFAFGMKNGELPARGQVAAPASAGLGIDVDWDKLDAADFYRYARCELSDTHN
ncbi:MAG: hypothetical protein K0U72_04545 [Gammaproteobacteria bacterium]|nr:hypothetical protein [Gammaproteobacteria bacterium]